MWLADSLIKDVEDARVKVFYLGRDKAKTWNSRRKSDEPVVFCGWYWAKGSKEGGPFKSESACYRDAHYVIVLKISPPTLMRDQHQIAVAEARRNLRTRNRRAA
jgi:hypothetical protein